MFYNGLTGGSSPRKSLDIPPWCRQSQSSSSVQKRKRSQTTTNTSNIALFHLAHILNLWFLQTEKSAKLQDTLIILFLSSDPLSPGFTWRVFLLCLLFLKEAAAMKAGSPVSLHFSRPAFCIETCQNIRKNHYAFVVWHLKAANSLSHAGTESCSSRNVTLIRHKQPL